MNCECITCADAAPSMRVVRLDAARGLALCEDGCGRRVTVEIGLLERVRVGETLLVHAGVAIAQAAG